MEKIKLSKKAKQILHQVIEKNYQITQEDSSILIELEYLGFVRLTIITNGEIWYCSATDKGKAYVELNPKLSNPSIWEDKKWLISTIVAILAILVTITIAIISNK